MADSTVLVAIYTDGHGTYQAQCLGCGWRGRWVKSEARAVTHAKAHRHDDGVA